MDPALSASLADSGGKEEGEMRDSIGEGFVSKWGSRSFAATESYLVNKDSPFQHIAIVTIEQVKPKTNNAARIDFLIFLVQANNKEIPTVFDEVAAQIYDLLPRRQQYNEWVKFTNVIQFPELPKEVDMRYYNILKVKEEKIKILALLKVK